MLLRLKIGLALALALGALLAAGGCAKQTVTYKMQPAKETPGITVAGTVTWQGDLKTKKLEMIARPYPKATFGRSKTIVGLDVPQQEEKAAPSLYRVTSSSISYRFNLPMAERGTKTTTATRPEEKPTVENKSYKAEYQIITVDLPPGWKSTPSEYKISQSTDKADFVLEKIAK